MIVSAARIRASKLVRISGVIDEPRDVIDDGCSGGWAYAPPAAAASTAAAPHPAQESSDLHGVTCRPSGPGYGSTKVC